MLNVDLEGALPSIGSNDGISSQYSCKVALFLSCGDRDKFREPVLAVGFSGKPGNLLKVSYCLPAAGMNQPKRPVRIARDLPDLLEPFRYLNSSWSQFYFYME
jgi:hypothetical protein